MADETKSEGKKGSFLSQIVAPVVVALLVGGTAPWWCSRKTPSNADLPVAPPGEIVVSREFFIGRWQVNQEIGSMTGTVATNYLENGRFEGYQLAVAGNQGQRLAESGTWSFEVLSSRTFRLSLRFDNGLPPFTGMFRIIDRNHIHNIGANYDAVRVE